MKWIKDKVMKQADANDKGMRRRYLLEVIDTMQPHGYTNMNPSDPHLCEIIDGYYSEGIAPAGIPYYVGKYADKDVIINWGADWATIKRQYFRED